MSNLVERVIRAKEARREWMAAVNAGRDHRFLALKWNTYVELANAAGPHVLHQIEREAAREADHAS